MCNPIGKLKLRHKNNILSDIYYDLIIYNLSTTSIGKIHF